MSDYIPNPANYVMKGNVVAPKPEQPAIRTDMTANEWKAMADSKLQELLQTSSGSLLLAAVRESKDRLEGKPAQAIHLDATVRQVTVNATIRFADQPLVIENETAAPISGNGVERIE